MTPNAALIEAMVAASLESRRLKMAHMQAEDLHRLYMSAALDALLAVRCTSPCPEQDCDAGLIYYGTDDHGGAEPCPSCDGSGSVDTGPAVVLREETKQVGWHGPYGVIPGGMDVAPMPHWVPVFILRPRPEQEP